MPCSNPKAAPKALPIQRKLAMPGTSRLALHGIRRLENSHILLEESNRSPGVASQTAKQAERVGPAAVSAATANPRPLAYSHHHPESAALVWPDAVT